MSDSEDPNHFVGSDSKPRWEHNKLDWPSPNVAIYICFLLKLCTYQNRMYRYGIQVIRDPSQNPTYRYWILKSTVHVNFGGSTVPTHENLSIPLSIYFYGAGAGAGAGT